jgi:hypothetical protein
VITEYNEFILESFLFTSQKFQDILKTIDDKMAKDFLELYNKDIKTSYNCY